MSPIPLLFVLLLGGAVAAPDIRSAKADLSVPAVSDGAPEPGKRVAVKDPRVGFSDADLARQFEFLIAVREKLTETMNVVRKIRDMRRQAEELVEKSRGGPNARECEEALEALNDKLYPIEERLVQYRARAGQDLINYPTAIDSKLARLMSFASRGDAPPTEGQRELFGRLSEGVAERVRAVEAIEGNEYAALLRLAGAER